MSGRGLALGVCVWLAPAEPTGPERPNGGAPDGPRVRWEVPAGCPARDELWRRVDRFSAEPSAGEEAIRALTLQIERRAERWVLELELVVDHGRLVRQTDAESCDLLMSAAALMIAVALDPYAVLDELAPAPVAGPEPAPVAGPEPPGAPAPEPAPSVEPAPLRARRPRPELRAGALVGWSGPAAPGLGLAVGGLVGATFEAPRPPARWRLHRHGVTLGGGWWAPVERTRAREPSDPTAPDVGVLVGGGAVTARYCYEPSRARWALLACAGPGLAWLAGRGRRVDEPRTSRQRWPVLELAFGARWSPTPWLWAAAEVGPRFGLARVEFTARGLGTIYATPPVGLAGALTLGLALAGRAGGAQGTARLAAANSRGERP